MSEEEKNNVCYHLIPYKDNKSILYFPLKDSLVVVNDQEKGAFLNFNLGDLIEPDKLPSPPMTEKQYFSCFIFPTLRCNMKCFYCYADSNKLSTDLSLDVAKKAIDYVFERCTQFKVPFSLFFAGGGEPTQNWEVVEGSVKYARRLAKESKIKTNITMTFNGVINDYQREFISKNFDFVRVSFDGLKEIQNHQRPLVNGGASYDAVVDTLDYFTKNKLPYDIRPSVTEFSVKKMSQNYEFLSQNFKAKRLLFIPAYDVGRNKKNQGKNFVQEYVKQVEKILSNSTEQSVEFGFLGKLAHFLACTSCELANAFILVPGNYISSCTHVSSPSDAGSETFFIGEYDADKDEFFIDQNKIDQLKKFYTAKKAACQKCISKYNCQGGCPFQNLIKTGTMYKTANDWVCDIRRQLLEIQLKHRADKLLAAK